MSPNFQFVNRFLSFLTLVSDLGLVLFVVFFLFYFLSKKMNKFWKNKIVSFFSFNALYLSLIVALTATLGSLFYSEIAHFEPCKLCWIQRIFMYPQVLLISMAIYKKDKNIADYSIALSFFGAIVAIYHYYLQRGGSPLTPCSVVGYSVSCSQQFTMAYGYITIPIMALTAFIMIMKLMWIYRQNESLKTKHSS